MQGLLVCIAAQSVDCEWIVLSATVSSQGKNKAALCNVTVKGAVYGGCG